MRNRIKKITAFAAAIAVSLSALSALASFPDISESDASYTAITVLDTLGIIDGDENGNFNPKNKVTRAEFAKLVVTMLGQKSTAELLNTTTFADSEDHWAAGYIQLGVSYGFIEGYDESTFGPDDPVTYAQAVKMLVSAAGYTLYAENSGGWPIGYLQYGNQLEITKSVSGALADTLVTKELAAVLIFNTLHVPLAEVSYNGAVPSYTIMDGSSGRDYKTLLTEKHNAYVVLGRVTETAKSSAVLQKGQVAYQVEVSDNFDGAAYTKSDRAFTMNAGSTNADSLLFYYTEAIVRKDTENDEYTILNIRVK